jgi:NAD(P)-dependent dehydrogenase (short-subunit alcohol dehydrogenase family)
MIVAPPVALILGYGSVVGQSVGKMLSSFGYRVAVGSRNPDKDDVKKHGFLPVTVDVTQPQTVEQAFAITKERLGSHASVVIYNGELLNRR